jgi:hypothetical protein
MQNFQSFYFLLFFLFSAISYSQVGIGTTDLLEGTSLQIDGDNSGLLINRVSLNGSDDTTTIPLLGLDQAGLMVYNTNTSSNLDPKTNVLPGFYNWDGTKWVSNSESGRNKNGWVALSDNDSTFTLPFVDSPDLTDPAEFTDISLDFTNPGDSTIETFAPDGYDSSDFYDSSIGRITPISVGDVIQLRLQFDAVPDNNNGFIDIAIDIATPYGIKVYEKTVPLLRGAGRNTNVSESILLYQLGTFYANGGVIRMAYSRANNNSGSFCDVSNFSLVINRLYTND